MKELIIKKFLKVNLAKVILLALTILIPSIILLFMSVANNSKNANVEVDTDESTVVVYLSGAVNKPGLFKISANARVFDVVNVGGGITPNADVSKINLAQTVYDGMQVDIPFINNANSEKSLAIPNQSNDNEVLNNKTVVANENINNTKETQVKQEEKININTATKEDFANVLGFGNNVAEVIMEYRKIHGTFKNTSELAEVPGVSQNKYNEVKDKLSN